jgi:CDGSH-type Zn-finger protein/uncharacterized Fe-S cluster protein YjdI
VTAETPEDAARPGHGRAPTRTYEAEGVAVVWEAGRCIHTARCIRALPQVFDPQARPWVAVGAAPADEVAAAVRACPTGALRYEPREGGVTAEVPEPVTTVSVSPNGPLMVRGDVTVVGPDGSERAETRVALCRCGATGNAPYCDNSHKAVGFSGGPLATRTDDAPEAGPCQVAFGDSGPYAVSGGVRVLAPSGAVLAAGERLWLCRCGRSGAKPFCDGSHERAAQD